MIEVLRQEELDLVMETNGILCSPEIAKAIAKLNNPFISVDDYTVAAEKEEINNKEVRTLIPNDKDDFRPNRAYFMIDENAFFIYNADKGVLVELPGI